MKTLGIFRHAKSDWNDARLRDFDRPLNARGRKGAAVMGKHIREHAVGWKRVLASPAVRVTQTLELACEAARETPPITWDRRIYLANSATLMEVLRDQDGDPPSIILVGHNPGLEDLIFDLVPDDGSSPLRDIVEEKFPTAAYAVLELDIDDWANIEDNCGRLTHLVRPRDLDPALGPSPVD
ncbi:SixA phosphatase family protein [Novosphingobium mangrovi (ex Huang et al. 2023)]|uniref:Histidine phosphatase family protein n=1 Tax=Novosphingobium mangrovi (ex Huang et al. 2023) TaxID=2976432 RepID=A0ABT2I3U8_9SPHN|nr:histidine phosphatase family protein [Novosphingobium mangrovi (ex Huang et al. 2023)]MCT2399460.1 histidine phosphatase family protein [Novosphingobium mangrovi (ex Huang et al. 2023)]